jgi:hypothetical protein
MEYDFSGWATRNNIECSDGRTILKDAFIDNDGQKVPLVWNHQHNDPNEVLGHALLENREEGVYAYCKFNNTESGQTAKALVVNGDVDKLSIYANRLKSKANQVIHGCIREVSLVLAGANPGAYIDSVVMHNADSDGEEEGTIYTDEPISVVIEHSDEVTEETEPVQDEVEEVKESEEEIVEETKETQLDEAEEVTEETTEESEEVTEETEEGGNTEMEHSDSGKTVGEVFETLNEEQKTAVYALIGQALEDKENDNKGEDDNMKHNVFENDNENKEQVLTHSDQMAIIELAKKSNVGSLKNAIEIYFAENDKLQHADGDGLFTDEVIGQLFPDYKLLNPGAPEMIDADYAWVDRVLNRAHKSPISRVRTRYVNLKESDIRAMGYEKKDEKKLIGQLKLTGRSHDPQTIYVKDKLERDDIIDITDFDIVAYQKGIMENTLKRELATAILIGDGREEGEEGKIKEAHVQSIWNDKELYTIHADVDIEAARAELQGTDTEVHFGENYIYAEAIITASLYAREKYKGSGALDFYCTPHLLNVMLLARDLNGRRIYNSKADLAQALNVKEIHTIEQFEGKTRTDDEGKTKKLLGLFVNMADYQIGSTKGGQITSFEDFDIDFNQYKYLMETRVSGALVKPFAAIALEEPTEVAQG